MVGVLSHPEETKNRSVYVHDIAISQKKLLELARKVAPDRKSRPVIFGYLGLAVFQDGYGGRLPQLDNELLGIKEMTEADIEALWRERLISK